MFRQIALGSVSLLVPFVLDGCSAASDASDAETSPTTEKALSGTTGTVFDTGGLALNVRAKPNLSSNVVNKIAAGKKVQISCQVSGDAVNGTKVWDYLPAYGGYASDAFLYTGTDGFIAGVPKCSSSNTGTSGCGSLDYAGKCDGDLLAWCESGVKHEKDCSESGRTCAYQNSDIGYNCIADGGSTGGGQLLTVGQIVGGANFDVTQDYGPTDFDGGYSYCDDYGQWGGQLVHCGVDIGIPAGTPLFVPGDGTVLRAGGSGYFEDAYNKSAGELKIQLSSGDHVILGHMSQIDLWVGQSVTRGQAGGLSGQMNGPHVHIEVRVPVSSTAAGMATVDPMTYFGW
jgi:hypothetical protein